ncbi:MAG: hypothetical protein ABI273_04530 [Lacunisphaera sp.]
MKSLLIRGWLLLGLMFLAAGCATYKTQVDHGRSLKGIKRFFVVSNLNDNHAIDHQIADVLKARGLEADNGPLTMMPDNTQAVVTFQDHWTWDFGDHLVYLQIAVRDTRSEQSFASITFSAKIPLHEDAAVTVERLVDQLLDKK